LIDNKPVKVEVVVANADLIPQPKPLAARIAQPKAQPKSAATVKNTNGNKEGGAGKKKTRRGRSNRPVKKTLEELDSEMADYFASANTNDTNANNANGTSSATAAGGDAPMEEDVL